MRFFQLACLAGVVSTVLNASAIIYDSVSESNAGADIVDFSGPFHNSVTSVAAGPLTGLQLILSGYEDDTSSGSVDVGLYADISTTQGGLIAVPGNVPDSALSDVPAIYDVTLTTYPLLTDDTLYWIGLSATTTAEWHYDYDNTEIGVADEFFSSQAGLFSSGDDPYLLSANEGVPKTPEPPSSLLIGVGAVVVALLHRLATRRKE